MKEGMEMKEKDVKKKEMEMKKKMKDDGHSNH
jgi:hypothetical protein